jgi:hyperosmotically inducible periplasmic protein
MAGAVLKRRVAGAVGTVVVAAVVVAAALLCGCVAAVIGNSPHSGTPADTRAVAQSPAPLDAAVRERLGVDPALRGAAVSVSAAGGTVTLRGTVATVEQRAAAERAARAVAGVGAVNNQLKVN